MCFDICLPSRDLIVRVILAEEMGIKLSDFFDLIEETIDWLLLENKREEVGKVNWNYTV